MINKRLFAIVLLLIFPMMVFAEELTKEEINTVRKLKNYKIIEKDRTFEELKTPLSAMDTFSALIKTKSYIDDDIIPMRMMLTNGVVTAHLEEELLLLKSELSELKKNQEKKENTHNSDWILYILVLIGIAT